MTFQVRYAKPGLETRSDKNRRATKKVDCNIN